MDIQQYSNITPIDIEEEMRTAYIDYAMSVIVSRALPDVRDGLKPVHRRVLFSMDELGLGQGKPFKKSARIVGDCLGKYHPHGDASVYDTLVRMAQEWSLRYPLVDGQGNFGSVDGDSPASMRYTEARLQKIAEDLLLDLEKDTVDFHANFDDSLQEPSVLPCKIPNLLVNGTSGIAVGMATNMAPHNLQEVIGGILAYIENENITTRELMEFIPAPDFPTGGEIFGIGGIKQAYETGRGRVIMRAKADIETTKTGKMQIIVTEIPYLVNKANLVERTAELVQEKKIEGISDIRDESDREGLRIVYELRKDAVPQVVLNQLYNYTALQSSFGINNVALVKGRPMTLSLKEMIHYFVEHRHDVVYRRTQYELKEAKARQHILDGFLIALDNLDKVIALIRASSDADIAKTDLIAKFDLSEIQAKAILEMRLQRLTGMERDKIVEEHQKITALVIRLEEIMANKSLRAEIIRKEMEEMRDKYPDKRRSKINLDSDEFSDEDMIKEEQIAVTISHEGYIKRISVTEYRTQGRGGVGSRGTSKGDDFTEHLIIASTHDYLLIFTESGQLFWIKGYKIPEASKTAKGRNIQNLLQMTKEDKVKAIVNVRNLDDEDFIKNHYLVMCTKKGVIKKTTLEAFSRPRQAGIRAISFQDDSDDCLLNVELTNGNADIIIGIRSGRAIRFPESKIRPMGRTAMGVRGIRLAKGDPKDQVVGMVCIEDKDHSLMVVSEKGYGKRSDVDEYRITNRGGKGVKTIKVTEKTGYLVAIQSVTNQDDLMIINKSGMVIRMALEKMRIMGRNAQGVRLIRLQDGDEIASVARISRLEGEEIEESDLVENLAEIVEVIDESLEADDEVEADDEIEETEE